MSRRRQYVFLGLPFVAIYGIGVLIMAILAIPIADHWLYSPKPFVANQWRAGDSRQRARMVADLQRRRVLAGKTREEVVEMLGTPDAESPRTVEYTFIYGKLVDDSLGLPFSGWPYRLQIGFDETTGRVDGWRTYD